MDDPVEDTLFCAKSSPDRGGRRDASPWCVLSPGGGRCQRSAPNPPLQLASGESGSWELEHHRPSAGSGQNPQSTPRPTSNRQLSAPRLPLALSNSDLLQPWRRSAPFGTWGPFAYKWPHCVLFGGLGRATQGDALGVAALPQPQGQSRFWHGKLLFPGAGRGAGRKNEAGTRLCLSASEGTVVLDLCSRAGDGQVSHFTDEETEASWSDCLQVLLIRGGAWALASAQPPTLPPHSWHVGAGQLEMLLGLHLSGLPRWLSWERICLQCRRDRGSTPGSGKIPLEKGMVTHSMRTAPKRSRWREAFLPAEFPEPRTTLEQQWLQPHKDVLGLPSARSYRGKRAKGASSRWWEPPAPKRLPTVLFNQTIYK